MRDHVINDWKNAFGGEDTSSSTLAVWAGSVQCHVLSLLATDDLHLRVRVHWTLNAVKWHFRGVFKNSNESVTFFHFHHFSAHDQYASPSTWDQPIIRPSLWIRPLPHIQCSMCYQKSTPPLWDQVVTLSHERLVNSTHSILHTSQSALFRSSSCGIWWIMPVDFQWLLKWACGIVKQRLFCSEHHAPDLTLTQWMSTLVYKRRQNVFPKLSLGLTIEHCCWTTAPPSPNSPVVELESICIGLCLF